MGLITLVTTSLLPVGGSTGQAPLLTLIDYSLLERLCHFDLKCLQTTISSPTKLYHQKSSIVDMCYLLA
jgi:hypothetical protein